MMMENNRMKEFFARNASMTAMLVMVILVGMGEKMAERFLPLYLIALGGSTWSVGFLNAMDNLLGALYSLPVYGNIEIEVHGRTIPTKWTSVR
jgi:hypothetical protein